MAQKTVSELILFKGAYYALEQCGLLLRHSAILHKEQVASTAAGLALLAREELGKYRILLDLWRKAMDTGSCPSPEDIHHAIEDHVEKQKQAQLSVTNRMQGPGGLLDRLRSRIRCARQTTKAFEQLDKQKRRRTPDDRHASRMRAFYVDPSETGQGWNRPSDFSPTEARDILNDAVNDYSIQRSKMISSSDPMLMSALNAWPDPPELPLPPSPDMVLNS